LQDCANNKFAGYIDLYLIHNPGDNGWTGPNGNKEGRLATWKAMAEAVEAGQIKSIGVSNYEVKHLEELAEWQAAQPKGKAGVLSVNQMELHPWCRYKDVVEWCEKRGVVLDAYSPLTRGKHFDDVLLKPIIARTGKSAAQILIRWSLQMVSLALSSMTK
jgi:diketogulonate reductase-like aldo/keto reductase